jgi:S1-C subfamily serine protease
MQFLAETDIRPRVTQLGVGRADQSSMNRRCLVLGSLILGASGCARTSAISSAPAAAPVREGPRDCSSGVFDSVAVQQVAAAGTVLVKTGSGFGSGFVIGEGSEQLIVTNHHVVANGGAFAAQVTLPDGQKQSVALEGVLASRDDDLALLRPASELPVAPLPLEAEPLRLGQPIAVVGYPGVRGSELSRTLEPGTVTAVNRTVRSSVFLQTNANINPGNSGGPLVDSCGRVRGIVTGKHRVAERVGLVVPIEALSRLLERYRAPRLGKQEALERQMQTLLTDVKFRRNERAARFFSPVFVQKTSIPILEKLASSANEKIQKTRRDLKRRGKDPAKMSKEAFLREVAAHVGTLEMRALLLATDVKEQRIDAHRAGHAFLALTAAEQFGALEDLWLEGTDVTREGCANAHVTVISKAGPERYTLHLHEEWGEWVVEKLERVR